MTEKKRLVISRFAHLRISQSLCLCGVICAFALTTFAQSSGGPFRVTSSTVGGGGGASGGGTIAVQGTAGQPTSGSTSKAPFGVSGGVWPTTNIGPIAAPGSIIGVVITVQGLPLAGVTIVLSGGASREAITDATGKFSFDGLQVNSTYTLSASLVNFSFAPPNRSLSLSNSQPAATFTATANSDHLNPLDTTEFFVRQHYLDFFSREPDSSGFNFWTQTVTSCGSDQPCAEVKRINLSGAFFLSIEFQQTGYLIERMYKVAFGDASGASSFNGAHPVAIPIVRFNEFLSDTRTIGQGVVVLQPGWEQVLESNKQAFAAQFVARPLFVAAFPATLTPEQFVDRLNQNAGTVLSSGDRATIVNLFGGGADTSNTTARAQALRQIAENQNLYNAEFNRAFVLMQYFGYLRRNLNDAPDTDYTGYDFWLTKLNQFNGNFIQAEMVKAFISSDEYRHRFAQ